MGRGGGTGRLLRNVKQVLLQGVSQTALPPPSTTICRGQSSQKATLPLVQDTPIFQECGVVRGRVSMARCANRTVPSRDGSQKKPTFIRFWCRYSAKPPNLREKILVMCQVNRIKYFC